MRSYTVHEPPNPPSDRLSRADKLVFVREGFSWMAALFAPIWMLLHRMWLVFILYLIGMAALGGLLTFLGVRPQMISLASLAIHVALGFELGALRRWTLERKGWRMLSAVTGRNRTECERRFFQAWLGETTDDDGKVAFAPPEPPVTWPPVSGPALPDGAVGSQV